MQCKKSKMLSILTMLLFIVCIFFGVACSDIDSSSFSMQEETKKYVLNQPVLELSIGETFQLSVLNIEQEEMITWQSTKSNVASVDDAGLVTAVAVGRTSVTATVGDTVLTCYVTVTIALDIVPTIELKGVQRQDEGYVLRLMLGDEFTLYPTLYVGEEELEATFTVESNEETIKVDGKKIKAVKTTTTAQITLSCVYEGETYTTVCCVTVEEVAS